MFAAQNPCRDSDRSCRKQRLQAKSQPHFRWELFDLYPLKVVNFYWRSSLWPTLSKRYRIQPHPIGAISMRLAQQLQRQWQLHLQRSEVIG